MIKVKIPPGVPLYIDDARAPPKKPLFVDYFTSSRVRLLKVIGFPQVFLCFLFIHDLHLHDLSKIEKKKTLEQQKKHIARRDF